MHKDNSSIYNINFKCKSGTTNNVPFSAIPSDILPVSASNVNGFNKMILYNDFWGANRWLDRIDIFGLNNSNL